MGNEIVDITQRFAADLERLERLDGTIAETVRQRDELAAKIAGQQMEVLAAIKKVGATLGKKSRPAPPPGGCPHKEKGRCRSCAGLARRKSQQPSEPEAVELPLGAAVVAVAPEPIRPGGGSAVSSLCWKCGRKGVGDPCADCKEDLMAERTNGQTKAGRNQG